MGIQFRKGRPCPQIGWIRNHEHSQIAIRISRYASVHYVQKGRIRDCDG